MIAIRRLHSMCVWAVSQHLPVSQQEMAALNPMPSEGRASTLKDLNGVIGVQTNIKTITLGHFTLFRIPS